MYPSIHHNNTIYDMVKLAGVDAIMGKITDPRFQVLAVSTWDGSSIKALLRVGDNGGEYVVIANKTVNGLELTVELNYRYKEWIGVEMDDLGLGLPRWSKAARDPGREIWEHQFRDHKKNFNKNPPLWVNQPERIKMFIRDSHQPGTTVRQVDGSAYHIRKDSTWYYSKPFTIKHLIPDPAAKKAMDGVAEAYIRQFYNDEQWIKIKNNY